MTEGCNSLATAKSARTSFSPSPTCDDDDREVQRNNNVNQFNVALRPSPEKKNWKMCFLTYLEVKVAALMLKNVAFDSAATALALKEEVKAVIRLKTLK